MADFGWTVEELLGAIVFGPDHGESPEGMAWTAGKLRVAAEFLEYRSANLRKQQLGQLGAQLGDPTPATQQAPAKRKRRHRATRSNANGDASQTVAPAMFPAEGAVE